MGIMGVPLFNIKHSTAFSTVIVGCINWQNSSPCAMWRCGEMACTLYKVPPYACKLPSYVAASFLCWVMPCCQDIGGTCPAHSDHVQRQLTHHKMPPYAHKAICTGLPHSLFWVLCYCQGIIVHSHTLPFFIGDFITGFPFVKSSICICLSLIICQKVWFTTMP